MFPSKGFAEATFAGAWLQKDGFLLEPRLRAQGLKHGFTTRRLGNMKDPGKRQAAVSILGLPEPLFLKQVHGTVIHRAANEASGLKGDGWTLGPGDEGLCVGVYVADCMPLYLWSDDGRYAGVFHAGWRGMAAGMPRKAVEALALRGASAAGLNAAFGPHIGADAYKVDPEHPNLDADARRQLTAAGLRASAMGPAAPCTASNDAGYFSFRRDRQDARMLALLSLDTWPS